MKYIGLGRVDILLIDALGARIEHTSAKGYNLSADSEPWEYGSVAVAVSQSSVIASESKTCLHNKIFADPFFHSSL